jgi:hypothetical protein
MRLRKNFENKFFCMKHFSFFGSIISEELLGEVTNVHR